MGNDVNSSRLVLLVGGLLGLLACALIWGSAKSAIHEILAQLVGLTGMMMLTAAVLASKLDEATAVLRQQTVLLERLVALQNRPTQPARLVSPQESARPVGVEPVKRPAKPPSNSELLMARSTVAEFQGRSDLSGKQQQELARALALVARSKR